MVATTPGRVPSTPMADPRGLAMVPTTPRLRLSTLGVVSITTAKQETPSTPIEFTSPPSDITEFVDAFHDDEEVRFRRLDSIIHGSAEEPPTFTLAKRDENWRRAMLEEMKTPPGCHSISLKWVYKVKRDELSATVKHKACLVAQGFVQREGIDFEEVFAPVARMESVRLLLALAVAKDWCVHHLDVKSAFLNGELTETVFVRQPPGFTVKGEEHR